MDTLHISRYYQVQSDNSSAGDSIIGEGLAHLDIVSNSPPSAEVLYRWFTRPEEGVEIWNRTIILLHDGSGTWGQISDRRELVLVPNSSRGRSNDEVGQGRPSQGPYFVWAIDTELEGEVEEGFGRVPARLGVSLDGAAENPVQQPSNVTAVDYGSSSVQNYSEQQPEVFSEPRSSVVFRKESLAGMKLGKLSGAYGLQPYPPGCEACPRQTHLHLFRHMEDTHRLGREIFRNHAVNFGNSLSLLVGPETSTKSTSALSSTESLPSTRSVVEDLMGLSPQESQGRPSHQCDQSPGTDSHDLSLRDIERTYGADMRSAARDLIRLLTTSTRV